eukprot:3078248-Rhodomonas_salina.2
MSFAVCASGETARESNDPAIDDAFFARIGVSIAAPPPIGILAASRARRSKFLCSAATVRLRVAADRPAGSFSDLVPSPDLSFPCFPSRSPSIGMSCLILTLGDTGNHAPYASLSPACIDRCEPPRRESLGLYVNLAPCSPLPSLQEP